MSSKAMTFEDYKQWKREQAECLLELRNSLQKSVHATKNLYEAKEMPKPFTSWSSMNNGITNDQLREVEKDSNHLWFEISCLFDELSLLHPPFGRLPKED